MSNSKFEFEIPAENNLTMGTDSFRTLECFVCSAHNSNVCMPLFSLQSIHSVRNHLCSLDTSEELFRGNSVTRMFPRSSTPKRGSTPFLEFDKYVEIQNRDLPSAYLANNNVSKQSPCSETGNSNKFWIEAHAKIVASGVSNFQCCKIEVPTAWNVALLDLWLTNYEDRDIIDFIRYGWPLDVSKVALNAATPPNQSGARNNSAKVLEYLEAEKSRGAIIGPFSEAILGENSRFSPLDAIPKKDSSDLRFILNLSWPVNGKSVNDAISKDEYMGKEVSLTYPGVDDMIKLIRKKGRGSLLFKKDLKKFYRYIYMDPGVIHVLGYTVNMLRYYDVVLSMGLRIACYIAQRISTALMYVFKLLSFEGLNYLDDLGSVEFARLARKAYDTLTSILRDLHIEESISKACEPSTVMTFLGLCYNTDKFTVEITKDRLQELTKLLKSWLSKRSANIREVQSLLGKLSFACSTVRSGRVFLARVIQFLVTFKNCKEYKEIPEYFRKDIIWWLKFMKLFDGISLLPDVRWYAPDAIISTDACLTACGGWARGSFFHQKFSPKLINDRNIHINELECLAIVMALKVWSHKIEGKNVLLQCDNESTVQVVNLGKAHNEFTQHCLREIVWLTARNNAWIKVHFIPGVRNRFADWCSRLHLNSKYWNWLKKEYQGNITQVYTNESMFKFSHTW